MNETIAASDAPIPRTNPRVVRRAALWSAFLVFMTAGYFHTTNPGWNIASRFDLALALAERGTFSIDEYHDFRWMQTNDKAFYKGRYYTDKSPVTPMLAAPIVWVYRALNIHTGMLYRYEYALLAVTWLIVGGAAAGLAALLTLLFIQRGVSPRRAAGAGAYWIAGTPLLGYSIIFYDYLPACVLLAAAFFAAQPAWREAKGASFRRMLLAGILGGLACWTLNTSAIAVIALTFLVAAGPPGKPSLSGLLRRMIPWAIGGIIGASGNFIYNYAIFGSIRPAYTYEFDPFFREQMSHGLMGAGWPRPFIIWLQTFDPFQGLFLWFPATAAAAAGCVWMIVRNRGADRRESAMAIASLSLFLLYVSGYYMWWGGQSGYAPRHLIPALPFLAIGLVPWLRPGTIHHKWMRIPAAILGVACLAALLAAIVYITSYYMRWLGPNPYPAPRIETKVPLLLLGMLPWLRCNPRTEKGIWAIAAIAAIFNLIAAAVAPQGSVILSKEALMHADLLPDEVWPAPILVWVKYFISTGYTDSNIGRMLGMNGYFGLLTLVAFWAAAFWALPRWLRGAETIPGTNEAEP